MEQRKQNALDSQIKYKFDTEAHYNREITQKKN